MGNPKPEDVTRAFQRKIKQKEKVRYLLRLYVTGMTYRSSQAIQNVKTLCEEHLGGRYDLEIVDIYQQPALARAEQIVATPTLIKKRPQPLRRFIGGMADTERILLGLGVRPKS